jgi:hypothetical protein
MVAGKMLNLRCSVSEKFSGDAQAVCEHILQSLEVPKAEKQEVEPDDPPADERTGNSDDTE